MSSSFRLAKASEPCSCGEVMVAIRRGKTVSAGDVNCMSCGKLLAQKVSGYGKN